MPCSITSTPLRVLIAEDQEDIRISLSRVIKALGHTVVGEAKTGDELISLTAQIGSKNIDIFCVDVGMPPGKYGGITCIRKAWDECRWRIPSIVISGNADDQLAKELSGDPRIKSLYVKPVDSKELDVALCDFQREKERYKIHKEEQGKAFAAMSKIAKRHHTSIEQVRQLLRNYANNTGKPFHEAVDEILRIYEEQEEVRREIRKKMRGSK